MPPLTHSGWPLAKAQLSLPVALLYVTWAEHWPGDVVRTKLAEHAIVGACASFTVTVNTQVAVFATGEAPSAACHVTTVVPLAKVWPLAVFAPLTSDTVTVPQLSVATGAP